MAVNLSCESCGARIPAANMNLELLVASCPGCDAVFPFAEQVGRAPDATVPAALGAAEVLPPRPAVVKEREGPDGLTLTVSWFGWQALVLIAFTLFWNGVLVVMATELVATGEIGGLAFMSFHAVAGLAVGYYAIASVVNRTQLTVNRVGIDVHHGPLPWPGNKTLPVAEFDQLYVEVRIIQGRGTARTVWDLKARGRGGQELVVAKGLDSQPAARFLERRIEHYLGIEDQPVAGVS